MTKPRKGEYARIGVPHFDESGNSRDSGFYDVGRDRFTLSFRTLNRADFEQIFSEIQAEVEL
jgi:hypothetical protein